MNEIRPCGLCGTPIPAKYGICSACAKIASDAPHQPQSKTDMDYLARRIAVENQNEIGHREYLERDSVRVMSGWRFTVFCGLIALAIIAPLGCMMFYPMITGSIDLPWDWIMASMASPIASLPFLIAAENMTKRRLTGR